MPFSAANCFVANSLSHSTVTSNANMLLMVAFAAITAVTALTENVSSEISNYIEQVPVKKDNTGLIDSQQKQLVEKSSVVATTLKTNDSETSRRGRYFRTMSPSMAAAATAYQFQRRSMAAAAAAAAAAADEDLRNFGRISKYHAIPYDGRKHLSILTASRRPYGVKAGYRAPAAAASINNKHKWYQPQLSNEAFLPHRGYGNGHTNDNDNGGVEDDDVGAAGDYVAFPSDEFTPYEDYYGDGQSMAIANDDDNDDDGGDGGGGGRVSEYKKRNHHKENAAAAAAVWYSKHYREKLEKEREAAAAAAAVTYEDVEPALSLEHAIGKRIPFGKYGSGSVLSSGDFESYSPISMDGRYKNFKFTRGQGEPNTEPNNWLNSAGAGAVGGKRDYAAAAAVMLSKYRRPQRPSSTWSALSPYNSYKWAAPDGAQSTKYSPFATDQGHRFKMDNSQRYAADAVSVAAMADANNDDFEKRVPAGAIKAHLYRRRNKIRERGRHWPSVSPSSLNQIELAAANAGGGSSSGSGSSELENYQENAISTTTSRRPSQPNQEEDVVVYSSRYRNKQAAAAVAAQRVLDTYDGVAAADQVDRSRILFNYHRDPATKHRQRFATLDKIRKSNRNSDEDAYLYPADVDVNTNTDADIYDAPSPSMASEIDDVAINESHSPPRKSNYKVSSSTSSPVFLSPSSFSYSSYNRKNSNRRPSSTTTTTTTAAPATATQKTTTTTATPANLYGYGDSDANPDLDLDFDSNSNTNGNGGGGGVVDFKADLDGERDRDRISAGELIAYMSASPSEPVVHKQDRFANEPSILGYPFVRTFSEQREKPAPHFYKSPSASATNHQDFEINLDQYTYRRRRRRRRRR